VRYRRCHFHVGHGTASAHFVFITCCACHTTFTHELGTPVTEHRPLCDRMFDGCLEGEFFDEAQDT
jgi:hypothetical protein